MRMRKKKNLEPRLEAVADYIISDPESYSGKWRAVNGGGYGRLWVELGCGMGRFASQCAADNPDVMFVAAERVPEALVVAAEKAKAAGAVNLRVISGDAARINAWFADGEIDRLYVQFCDPWPKKKQYKRRLTSRGFLELYARALAADGQLWFKSDNRDLVEFTRLELLESGWEILEYSADWHAEPSRPQDEIMTEYEMKFSARGVPIGRVTAKKNT